MILHCTNNLNVALDDLINVTFLKALEDFAKASANEISQIELNSREFPTSSGLKHNYDEYTYDLLSTE